MNLAFNELLVACISARRPGRKSMPVRRHPTRRSLAILDPFDRNLLQCPSLQAPCNDPAAPKPLLLNTASNYVHRNHC